MFIIKLLLVFFAKNVLVLNCQKAPKFDLRLANGTDYMGRVEIFYENTWGTICDESFDNKACEVVCRQLNFRGGLCINNGNEECLNNESNFSVGSDHIWLDEVKCLGMEQEIGECQFGNWGSNSSDHIHDVGCICEAPKIAGICERNRHRIVPFNDSHPGIGFVEFRGLDGKWYGICDDVWGANESRIFCNCLGYVNFSNPQSLQGNDREVDEVLFDGIECLISDVNDVMNIWDCNPNLPTRSQCNSRTESAAIACQDVVHSIELENDEVVPMISCMPNIMEMCIKVINESETIELGPHVFIKPLCEHAILLDYDEIKGYCFNIDLEKCSPLEKEEKSEDIATDDEHYCFEIHYEMNNSKDILFETSKSISQRGCCMLSMVKNISGIFRSNNLLTSPATSRMTYNLETTCYVDSSFSQILDLSSDLLQGDMLYCKIKADIFDPTLILIIDACSFRSSNNATEYVFIENGCSKTDISNILYFNLGQLEWGVGFRVPRFDSSNEIYLTCQARLCSNGDKQNCDRSCQFDKIKEVISEEYSGEELSKIEDSVKVNLIRYRRDVGSSKNLEDGSGDQIDHLPLEQEEIEFEGLIKSKDSVLDDILESEDKSYNDFDVILKDGASSMGRLEIFYSDQWGSICDESFDNNACQVVCRQLNLRGGLCINERNPECITNKTDHFPAGSGTIWLDAVKCFGFEQKMSECQLGNWGVNDCDHKYDVGCVCEEPKIIGQCELERHRIVPFEELYPGIGFVEVRGLDGIWSGVCDDTWGIDEARIFCGCLGYHDVANFQALINIPKKGDGYLLDGIDCSKADKNIISNIWDCNSDFPKKGKCDPRSESAAVVCQKITNLPMHSNDSIQSSVSCGSDLMTICLKNNKTNREDVTTAKTYILPFCETAKQTYDQEKGICFELDLNTCQSLQKKDNGEVQYCVNIYYEETHNDSFLYQLLKPLNLIARSGCCTLPSSKSVVQNLFPNNQLSSPLMSEMDYRLEVQCFEDSKFSKKLPSLNIRYGEMLYCKIKANIFDPSLILVVDSCYFEVKNENSQKIVFFENRCNVANNMNILYYNLAKLEWGFGLQVPRFKSGNEISLSCSARLCNRGTTKESKAICDRSCQRNNIMTTEDSLNAASLNKNPDILARVRRYADVTTKFDYNEDYKGHQKIIHNSSEIEKVNGSGENEVEITNTMESHDDSVIEKKLTRQEKRDNEVYESLHTDILQDEMAISATQKLNLSIFPIILTALFVLSLTDLPSVDFLLA